MNDLMKEKEVAAWLRLSVHTLRNWRVEGRGPTYVKAGGAVVYLQSDVEKWLGMNRVVGDDTDQHNTEKC